MAFEDGFVCRKNRFLCLFVCLFVGSCCFFGISKVAASFMLGLTTCHVSRNQKELGRCMV